MLISHPLTNAPIGDVSRSKSIPTEPSDRVILTRSDAIFSDGEDGPREGEQTSPTVNPKQPSKQPRMIKRKPAYRRRIQG
jgi:hypothetical protein